MEKFAIVLCNFSVLVTGCMSDRKPCALHFFRNYDPPGIDYKEETEKSKFPAPPPPNGKKVFFTRNSFNKHDFMTLSRRSDDENKSDVISKWVKP